MLEVQRQRGARHQQEIQFTRRLMWAHMILGAVLIALFLFHEIFRWFAGTALWYAASLLVMYGFMDGRRIFRALLALFFMAAAGAGVLFINRVFPDIAPPRGVLIPHRVIPIWVGMASLAYGVIALVVIVNPRVSKAAREGFTLW